MSAATWAWSVTSSSGKTPLTYRAKPMWPLVVSKLDESIIGGERFDTASRGWRIFFDNKEIPTGKTRYRTARDAQVVAEKLFEAIIPGLARMTTATIKLFGRSHDVE